MCKYFSRLFLGIFAALFVCALYLAALPSRLTADEIDGWQLRLVAPNGDIQAVPLESDYTQDGIVHTLSDPMIPLRTLANACSIATDYRQNEQYRAVLWASADNPWVFAADLPCALQIYKEENGSFAVRSVEQFEYPRIICQQLCIPVSFLDCLGLEYEIDAAALLITVRTEPAPTAQPDILWQTAAKELDRLFTPHRQLLAEGRVTLPDIPPYTEIESAQALLLAAARLHAEVIAPNEYLPCAPDNVQAEQALALAARNADLPQAADGRWFNDTVFPLQIACRVGAYSLTVQLYQLNSMAVAAEYLGQIAE